MASDKVNVQNIFLNKMRAERTKVNIYVNGKTKLHGVIVGFDEYTIALESGNSQTLVYKHLITSIAPQSPIRPIKSEQ